MSSQASDFDLPQTLPESLGEKLIAWAHEAGFQLAGIAPATAGLGYDRLRRWLDEGKHGDMAYMERHHAARADPNQVLEGVKSLLVVGLAYQSVPANEPGPGEGRISNYAWGRDYHEVIRERLGVVSDRLKSEIPEVRCRKVVDSAPVMERDYALLAGLGWLGKNTLVLSTGWGSQFFLGALLLDAEIPWTAAPITNHCGTCRRCLESCPTSAFDGPYNLDPRRCISYLTIESKGIPDRVLQTLTGDWVYGCDICQDVCPWNQRASRRGIAGSGEFVPRDSLNPISLKTLLKLTHETFHEMFRGSAIERLGRDRLVRNALIAVGNRPDPSLLGDVRHLTLDSSPLVQEAAQFALRCLLDAGN